MLKRHVEAQIWGGEVGEILKVIHTYIDATTSMQRLALMR